MSTPFARRLAETAFGEFAAYGGMSENSHDLALRIDVYWTRLGYAFPGVATPWSGVFVCWCLKAAGATAQEFEFSALHAAYVHWAIANEAAGTGLFRGVAFDAVPPRLGDIVQWNRPGDTLTFADAAARNDYASHAAIVVGLDADHVFTVGGNESDSVHRSRLALGAGGIIRQRTGQPFMTLVRTLK